MIKRNLIIYVVSLLIIFGCNHNRTSEDTPSLLSVEMKGVSQDEIIRNLVEQTKEFDYCDKERHEIKRVMFCGVPCGLNFELEEENGAPTVTSVVLFTSHQDKATFDTFKNSISKKHGNPDLEKYEGGTEEIGGRYYGKKNHGVGSGDHFDNNDVTLTSSKVLTLEITRPVRLKSGCLLNISPHSALLM